MWGFHAIREKAITNLSGFDLDAVHKIIFSKKYDISGWLVPALNQIAQREEHLSIEDARRLSAIAGWELPIQIGHVRETYIANASTLIKVKSIHWPCSCTIWYCTQHAHSTTRGSGETHMIWPCATCNRYRCGHTIYLDVPQQVSSIPRSQHDFTPEIRRVFKIV
jgi:hypothetical protein